MDNFSSADDIEVNAEVNLFPKEGDLKLPDFTYQEITLGESLLTPGLQTSLVTHSYIHSYKDLDRLKKGNISIKLSSPRLSELKLPHEMRVEQNIYRLENRNKLDYNNEEMTFRACDSTMLIDGSTLVSKSWKCTPPSSIVEYVLRTCLGVKEPKVSKADPARDYIAENIHPFQVIAQQCNVALADGNDPSFVHYMTYEDYGTHHFKSLKELTAADPIMTFKNAEVGSIRSYDDPTSILSYSFPCDFDLLADILNGIDENGKDINSLMVFNPSNKMFSMLGGFTGSCGTGGGNMKIAQTNKNTAKDQNSCNFEVEKYLKKRQARMSLLEKDKVALRLTVPWNPSLHAGKVIRVMIANKEDKNKGNYGSGDYLILHMTHNIKRGGLAVTTMDCVSETVGRGVV